MACEPPHALTPAWCASRQAQEAEFLSAASCAAHVQGQLQLKRCLGQVVAHHGTCTDSLGGPADADVTPFMELPIQNLLFDGRRMRLLDYSAFQHGVGMLCIE